MYWDFTNFMKVMAANNNINIKQFIFQKINLKKMHSLNLKLGLESIASIVFGLRLWLYNGLINL